MWTLFSIHIARKSILVCLKSAVDKQLQISPKSNGSFWTKMMLVLKSFSCIILILSNLPSCFVIKGTSWQRSEKGAVRKRFPLQKSRWEKTKLTIWAQNYNPPLKLRKTLVKVANFDSIFYR